MRGLEMGDEPSQFLHAGRHQRRCFGHAAAERLVLFERRDKPFGLSIRARGATKARASC
ncbi:MAG: hypothetical protein ACREDV_11280 [Methylocella sp.]